MKTTLNRSNILLFVQRALLDEVFPQLRSVMVDYSENKVRLYFYVDGVISIDDADSLDCVETEVIADMTPDIEVVSEVIRLDAPVREPDKGICVYHRKEQ